MNEGLSLIEAVLRDGKTELLDAWVTAQLASSGSRPDLISESELRVESDRFLTALASAVAEDSASADTSGPAWDAVRGRLTELSESRATKGFSPTETATFVFSIKEPLFGAIQARTSDTAALADTLWTVTKLIDSLGLFTADST